MSGCVAFAKLTGPTRVESELLPQMWEQVRMCKCYYVDKTDKKTRILHYGDASHYSLACSFEHV